MVAEKYTQQCSPSQEDFKPTLTLSKWAELYRPELTLGSSGGRIRLASALHWFRSRFCCCCSVSTTTTGCDATHLLNAHRATSDSINSDAVSSLSCSARSCAVETSLAALTKVTGKEAKAKYLSCVLVRSSKLPSAQRALGGIGRLQVQEQLQSRGMRSG